MPLNCIGAFRGWEALQDESGKVSETLILEDSGRKSNADATLEVKITVLKRKLEVPFGQMILAVRHGKSMETHGKRPFGKGFHLFSRGVRAMSPDFT